MGMADLNESIRHIPIPDHLKGRPISATGNLIPWFVPRDLDGEPIAQAADPDKLRRAHLYKLCWCCGEPLGAHKAFLLGPMCMVNRITAEPPNHESCAEYAVRACPFLINPRMKRNPTTPEEHKLPPAGIMLKRNPGAVAIWITHTYLPFRDPNGGMLFSVGDPISIRFFREGRPATRTEILESINTGMPFLLGLAARENARAVLELFRQYNRALKLVPEDA